MTGVGHGKRKKSITEMTWTVFEHLDGDIVLFDGVGIVFCPTPSGGVFGALEQYLEQESHAHILSFVT